MLCNGASTLWHVCWVVPLYYGNARLPLRPHLLLFCPLIVCLVFAASTCHAVLLLSYLIAS
jgi:hypothetical protein